MLAVRRWPLFGCIAIVPLLWFRFTSSPDPLPGLPPLMLWAWESPQDLRFVKPGKAGIAFLARTVWLDGARVQSRPRLQPLRYTPGTALMAVVRFESQGRGLPRVEDVVQEVLPVVKTPGVLALQIDFDARLSERPWYAALLRELHRTLPPDVPLTITALESWCENDTWFRGLPVADATPMLFRMGGEDRASPVDFPAAICRSSMGVSLDELPARVPPARRIYFFNPGPWTQHAYDAAVTQIGKWHK